MNLKAKWKWLMRNCAWWCLGLAQLLLQACVRSARCCTGYHVNLRKNTSKQCLILPQYPTTTGTPSLVCFSIYLRVRGVPTASWRSPPLSHPVPGAFSWMVWTGQTCRLHHRITVGRGQVDHCMSPLPISRLYQTCLRSSALLNFWKSFP